MQIFFNSYFNTTSSFKKQKNTQSFKAAIPKNVISSLYGHQKGDHMKTIELSHKKHKANESQEKMTVTSRHQMS